MQETTGALILAAGRGTRMPSPRPKALQTLLGESMLALILEETAKLSGLAGIWTLVGHQAELVRAEVERAAAALPPSRADAPRIFCIEQKEQLGTGHALMTALPEMAGQAEFDRLLVLNGDVPLLSAPLLARFMQEAGDCDLAFLSLELPDPGAYGRVVRDREGRVRAIVEAKDYDPALHGADPHEINSGLYLIRRGAVIASHCILRDAIIGEDCRIHSFCHIESARVEARCLVGPYARLRPGAVLEEDAHMGNFVEMKNARLGRGSKASHLSYLGDAEIGPGVNIGAGTITCNYDGTRKHRTVIGAGSFIGSNTALVAPVELGEHTLVGAGSVITRDVNAGELAVARSRQVNLPRKK